MRGEPAASLEDTEGELLGSQQADGEHRIGLVDVESVSGLEVLELGGRSCHLASGHANADLGTERGIALDVLARKRLLEPDDVEVAEALRNGANGISRECGRGRPACANPGSGRP